MIVVPAIDVAPFIIWGQVNEVMGLRSLGGRIKIQKD